jgi:N6-L-threonylcarbamoyladenine synthase
MSLYIAIESSCDETSIALLRGDKDSAKSFIDQINAFTVEAAVVSSQIKTHAQYGGVVPEIGARKHADQIHWIFENLVKEAYQEKKTVIDILGEIKGIFVTTEPGLLSALRVGIEFGKTLQYLAQSLARNTVPLESVNHLHGHVASCFFGKSSEGLSEVFPHLHLLVSGGNSQIILLKSWSDWEIVGQTLDDAAGESLDKIGRMLGLPYPGGVYCARIAQLDDENRVDLPFGMKQDSSLNVSFSGLKTAVRYLIQDNDLVTFEQKLDLSEVEALLQRTVTTDKLAYIRDVCISAQSVVVEQLIRKFNKAIKTYHPASIGLSGGVSANKLLRSKMQHLGTKYTIPLYIPDMSLTGDNAVMIGLAGLMKTD